jgi:hypothetical protein
MNQVWGISCRRIKDRENAHFEKKVLGRKRRRSVRKAVIIVAVIGDML